jgi:plastocyanin
MRWMIPAGLVLIAVFCQAAQQPRAERGTRQIAIERSPRGESSSFTPATITVWAGDLVTWKNLTMEDHDPGVVNKDGSFVGFFAAPLKPGTMSQVFSPGAELDKDNKQIPYTIPYLCKLHRGEQGTIQVVPTP